MMNSQPRFETIASSTFIGMKISCGLFENRSYELWSQFMPRRKEIQNRKTELYHSIQIYPSNKMADFNEAMIYEKWAAAEVASTENIPQGMETLNIPEGLYAVFIHKGTQEDYFTKTSPYIFIEWLPQSGFAFDLRPQFEVFNDKHKPNDPLAEEEIWVPVFKK
jgi:AraC family transcriptional regulator